MVTAEQALVFLVIAVALLLFAWGRWRYDVVAVGAMLALVLTGVVPSQEAFASFGHPAVVTVAVVLAMSRALHLSGLVDWLVGLLRRVPSVGWIQAASITALAAVLSAFMNNVGALALMLPVALSLSRRFGLSVSVVLMPVAFGSLLGGLTTLIGTPPNVIIATFRQNELGSGFSMFDFTPVGLPVMLLGLIAITALANPLIPRRRESTEDEHERSPVERYTAELAVSEESGLAGRTVAELRDTLEDCEIVALTRGDQRTNRPSSRRVVRAGDSLLVTASAAELDRLVGDVGLEISRDRGRWQEATDTQAIEAVVMPGGALHGVSARTARLLERYELHLLAVARAGRRLRASPSDITLKPGDVILVEGHPDVARDRLAVLGCSPLSESDIRLSSRSAFITPLVFGSAIAAVAAGIVGLETGFVTALLVCVAMRQIRMRQVYQSIDWPVVVLLAAMLPIGHALESTGGAELIAQSLLAFDRAPSPLMLIALLMVLSMGLSNVVNNAATALLMAPIALDLARGIDASPDPFLMSVAVGSSCAFLTPIGHQSNLLVMGPGGYRFSDYWRLGLPLSGLVVAIASPSIMWAFPP